MWRFPKPLGKTLPQSASPWSAPRSEAGLLSHMGGSGYVSLTQGPSAPAAQWVVVGAAVISAALQAYFLATVYQPHKQ